MLSVVIWNSWQIASVAQPGAPARRKDRRKEDWQKEDKKEKSKMKRESKKDIKRGRESELRGAKFSAKICVLAI